MYFKYVFRVLGEVRDFMNKIGMWMRVASLKSERKESLGTQGVTTPF